VLRANWEKKILRPDFAALRLVGKFSTQE